MSHKKHPVIWGSPHLQGVSFEGPLTWWMSVLRVPSLAGCQFLEDPLTCLDVMWSLFWSKLDFKMKIWPTSGRFGENCLLKLVLVCLILTQWWNKKKLLYFPFKAQGPPWWVRYDAKDKLFTNVCIFEYWPTKTKLYLNIKDQPTNEESTITRHFMVETKTMSHERSSISSADETMNFESIQSSPENI